MPTTALCWLSRGFLLIEHLHEESPTRGVILQAYRDSAPSCASSSRRPCSASVTRQPLSSGRGCAGSRLSDLQARWSGPLRRVRLRMNTISRYGRARDLRLVPRAAFGHAFPLRRRYRFIVNGGHLGLAIVGSRFSGRCRWSHERRRWPEVKAPTRTCTAGSGTARARRRRSPVVIHAPLKLSQPTSTSTTWLRSWGAFAGWGAIYDPRLLPPVTSAVGKTLPY